jgi:hypothetical protein
MKFASAINLNRKSGVAQWRDLRLSFGSHANSLVLIRTSIARRTRHMPIRIHLRAAGERANVDETERNLGSSSVKVV